jgi:hypothetical protein
VIITLTPDFQNVRELGETFSSCGPVKSTLINQKGTGLVKFFHPDAANNALGQLTSHLQQGDQRAVFLKKSRREYAHAAPRREFTPTWRLGAN